MIPQYPDFRPLQFDDKSVFDKVLAENSPQLSEYTFSNLYAWRGAYAFEVSLYKAAVILKAQVAAETCFFMPLMSRNTPAPTGVMLSFLEQTKHTFIRIPEELAKILSGNPAVSVVEDRDNADYLYSTEDLVQLKGTKYDGKRNLIKNFKSKNRYEYSALTQSHRRAWADFEERWCRAKNCDTIENLDHERTAFKELLTNFESLRLVGGAMTIQGEIKAVALAGKLNPETMVMHVLKADPAITGLYQAMLNEFLSREASEYRYVNLEQDLGLAGLRKSKLSYQPVRLVPCYTVRLK